MKDWLSVASRLRAVHVCIYVTYVRAPGFSSTTEEKRMEPAAAKGHGGRSPDRERISFPTHACGVKRKGLSSSHYVCRLGPRAISHPVHHQVDPSRGLATTTRALRDGVINSSSR